MELRKGWLQRQMTNVHRDVSQWPDWMKRAARFKEDGVQAGKDGCTCYDETTRVCGVHRGEAWGRTIGELDALAEIYWQEQATLERGRMRKVLVAAEPIKLIGLVGRMGSGKDAVAALLHMRGYKRYAFADELRLEVMDILLDRGLPSDIPENKTWLYVNARRDEVWPKPTTLGMRKLLQYHGTEYRRKQDEDYWVNKLAPKLVGMCVVSDVRFPNEVKMIRDRGGVIWRVHRPGLADVSNHISERLVDDIKADEVIKNERTLYDLAGKVMERLG